MTFTLLHFTWLQPQLWVINEYGFILWTDRIILPWWTYLLKNDFPLPSNDNAPARAALHAMPCRRDGMDAGALWPLFSYTLTKPFKHIHLFLFQPSPFSPASLSFLLSFIRLFLQIDRRRKRPALCPWPCSSARSTYIHVHCNRLLSAHFFPSSKKEEGLHFLAPSSQLLASPHLLNFTRRSSRRAARVFKALGVVEVKVKEKRKA